MKRLLVFAAIACFLLGPVVVACGGYFFRTYDARGAVIFGGFVMAMWLLWTASVILLMLAYFVAKFDVALDAQGVTATADGKTQAMRWNDVAFVEQRWMVYGVHGKLVFLIAWFNGAHRGITLVDRQGLRMMLKNRVGDFPRLVKAVEAQTLARMFPTAWANFQRGARLTFGPYAISTQGIEAGGALLPWPEVKRVHVSRPWVVIEKVGSWTNWAVRDLESVPNVHVMLAVLDERAKSLGRP
ncbi:MAG TPA: DUF6585 family protein [Pirellulales bacterium]